MSLSFAGAPPCAVAAFTGDPAAVSAEAAAAPCKKLRRRISDIDASFWGGVLKAGLPKAMRRLGDSTIKVLRQSSVRGVTRKESLDVADRLGEAATLDRCFRRESREEPRRR